MVINDVHIHGRNAHQHPPRVIQDPGRYSPRVISAMTRYDTPHPPPGVLLVGTAELFSRFFCDFLSIDFLIDFWVKFLTCPKEVKAIVKVLF